MNKIANINYCRKNSDHSIHPEMLNNIDNVHNDHTDHSDEGIL